METPWEGGTKVYIEGPGHMTRMATTPTYIENKLKKSGSPLILKLGMQHQGLKLYTVYINYDPGLTLTYFTARSNWVA